MWPICCWCARLEREREFAVRAALGASRWRILRQLLTESLLLACARRRARFIARGKWECARSRLCCRPGPFRVWTTCVSIGRRFAFTAAVSLATGLLFGLAPAIRAARPDLQEALKEGGRGAASSRRVRRMGNLLVIGEVALAMLLLVGAGLIVQSFIRLRLTDPGFATEPHAHDEGQCARLQVWSHHKRQPSGQPGIRIADQAVSVCSRSVSMRCREFESAAVSERLPIGQWSWTLLESALTDARPSADEFWRLRGASPERSPLSRRRWSATASAPAYFRTVGMRLIRGRLFDERDTADTLNVALINETMARKYWPDEDPIGKSFALNFSSWFPKAEIIGVVSDIKTNGSTCPP